MADPLTGQSPLTTKDNLGNGQCTEDVTLAQQDSNWHTCCVRGCYSEVTDQDGNNKTHHPTTSQITTTSTPSPSITTISIIPTPTPSVSKITIKNPTVQCTEDVTLAQQDSKWHTCCVRGCFSEVTEQDWTTKIHSLSNKRRNKMIKMMNGNGKKSLNVAHWNLGAKLWQNKINAIQALVDTKSYDVLFISEANLHENIPTHETLIQGYKIIKPLIVKVHNFSRLVALVKNDLEVVVETSLMNDLVTSIWLKISPLGSRKMLLCGIYREHQFLYQPDSLSLQPAEQQRRWTSFMDQIDRSANNSSVHIIGDFNLDYNKWTTPEFKHTQLVNCSKNTLEAGGFTQLVDGITRSWIGQTDSLLDHIWSNNTQRILSCTNEVRAMGDHNLITMVIRTKGQDSRRLEIMKRSYKKI